MDVWKQFDQNDLTHSAAHHLVAIHNLLAEFGYARVSDVARRLQITRGSTSITLKRLKQKGYVIEDERRFLRLSPDGERIAHLVEAKRFVMKRLFVEILGVDEATAEVDTCKIEHLLSDLAAERVSRLLRFVDRGGRQTGAFLEALRAFESSAGTPGAAARLLAYFDSEKAAAT